MRFGIPRIVHADGEANRWVCQDSYVEINQLVAHKRGKDVKQAMKLLDQVARGEGEAMEAALKRLCEMARARQMR